MRVWLSDFSQMTPLRVAGLIVIFFFLGSCSHSPSIQSVQGQDISMQSLKGRWILLNYWSSWSESSLAETKQFDLLSKDLSGVATSLSHNYLLLPHESLSHVVAKLKLQAPVIKQSLHDYFHLPPVKKIPVTYIINPRGKLVEVISGVHSEQQIKNKLMFLIRQFDASNHHIKKTV